MDYNYGMWNNKKGIFYALLFLTIISCPPPPPDPIENVIHIGERTILKDQDTDSIDFEVQFRNDGDFTAVRLSLFMDFDTIDYGMQYVVVEVYEQFKVSESKTVQFNVAKADWGGYDLNQIEAVLMDKIEVYTDEDVTEPTYISQYEEDDGKLKSW